MINKAELLNSNDQVRWTSHPVSSTLSRMQKHSQPQASYCQCQHRNTPQQTISAEFAQSVPYSPQKMQINSNPTGQEDELFEQPHISRHSLHADRSVHLSADISQKADCPKSSGFSSWAAIEVQVYWALPSQKMFIAEREGTEDSPKHKYFIAGVQRRRQHNKIHNKL